MTDSRVRALIVAGEDCWLDEFVEACGAADAQTRTMLRKAFRTILRAYTANLKTHHEASPPSNSGAQPFVEVKLPLAPFTVAVRSGWTLDPDFLKRVKDCIEENDSLDLEDIEVVLLAYCKENTRRTLAAPAPNSGVRAALELVQEGSGEKAIPAILAGPYIRIMVDCRENYADPKPIALAIQAALALPESAAKPSLPAREGKD